MKAGAVPLATVLRASTDVVICTIPYPLTPGRAFGCDTAVPTGGDCAGSFCWQMPNVF